ncbi:MerR family transcriptional regulator [Mobilicoccus caccae]|uniref:MerR family transcriptional regulator n=2 Tax=Mobilicoccus caccae TaxID=1859295 RepID=A0ABQ6IKI2_9MICO|nr:MerR family transcriptional regulator [Mobilicoccus caccae]
MARASGTTVKRLRHYHDKGVFMAAHTDPATGHRWYEPAQVADAMLVAQLRRAGVPLAEISGIVAATTHRRDAAIRAALAAVDAELASARERLVGTAALLQAVPEVSYAVRRVPEQWVVSTAARLSREECATWFDRSFTDLIGRVGIPWGPLGATYSTEFFTDDHGTVTAFVPVAAGTPGAESLPGGTFAVAVHDGAYTHFDLTYAGLGRAVGRDLTSVSDETVRELYLVGPGHSDDPATWRSEVWWPVLQDSVPLDPCAHAGASTTTGRATGVDHLTERP